MNHEYSEDSELESEDTDPNGILSNGSIDNLTEQAAEAYEGTRAAVRDAYERTTKAVQSGYKRTLDYGTEHPERLALATFAVGIAAGTLLAAAAFAARHSKTERIATPLINAAAEVARAVFAR